MVRISGIVKTAERVKSQLQHGINPQEVDSLKAFVIKSLHTIDHICTEANTTPDSLPTRSRKAYYYLKDISWHNLPLTERSREEPTSTSVSTPSPTLRIKNIVKQQKNIQQHIGQLKSNHTDSQLESIRQTLTECVREIDFNYAFP